MYVPNRSNSDGNWAEFSFQRTTSDSFSLIDGSECSDYYDDVFAPSCVSLPERFPSEVSDLLPDGFSSEEFDEFEPPALDELQRSQCFEKWVENTDLAKQVTELCQL